MGKDKKKTTASFIVIQSMEVGLKSGEPMVDSKRRRTHSLGHFWAFSISRNFFSKTNSEILHRLKPPRFVRLDLNVDERLDNWYN